MKLYKLDILRYNDKQLEKVAKLMGFEYSVLSEFQGAIDVCFDEDGLCVGKTDKKLGFIITLEYKMTSTKETTFTSDQLKSCKSRKRSKITRLDLRKYNYDQLISISEILGLNPSDLIELKPKSDEVWFYDTTPAGYTEKKSTNKVKKGLYIVNNGFHLTSDIENLVKSVKLTTFSYKKLKESSKKTGSNPLIDESNMSDKDLKLLQETRDELRDTRIRFGLESGKDWADKADDVAFKSNPFDVEKKGEKKVSKVKVQQSIDEILEKIGTKGMDSLTKKELAYLNENSKKLK